MELHHLRHFVAVAEELHFGRAAARLGMAQPPLSQSIRRLETSLGVQLLERTRRNVSLTPAGRVLLEEARRILTQVELAQSLARRAANSGIRRLRVGVTPMVIYSVVPRALTAFRKRWPGVEIMLEECSTRAQIKNLLNGDLDIGVFMHYGEKIQGLSMRSIERRNFSAAVPSSWPLARKKRIRLAELAEHPWVMHDPALNPSVYAALHAACRAAGFTPQVAQHANQGYALMSLVASGVGVMLSGSTFGDLVKMEGVTFLPVIDLPPDLHTEYMLAWVPHASSPPLSSFIALVEEMAKNDGKTPARAA